MVPHIGHPVGRVSFTFCSKAGLTLKPADMRLPLRDGDIVIFPHGHPHILENGPAQHVVDGEREPQKMFPSGLQVSRVGGEARSAASPVATWFVSHV